MIEPYHPYEAPADSSCDTGTPLSQAPATGASGASGPADSSHPSAAHPSGISVAWTTFRAWLTRVTSGRFHTIWYALLGLTCAILILAMGFFPALLVIVLVAIGAGIGLYQDGNRFLRSLVARIIERLSS